MVDVCFVLMPYADITHPSLAIGILKGCLNQAGISSTAVYGNLKFADKIGTKKYGVLDRQATEDLVGEWTFSHLAFPDFSPDYQQYFEQVLTLRHDSEMQQELWKIREAATVFIEELAQEILSYQPKIVSCSSTFQQHCASLAILRRIKSLKPEIITLMGGANCEGIMGVTTHREFPWVDFVASGEGDELFAPLCRLLIEEGREIAPEKVPYGVITPRDREVKRKWETAPRAIIHNLDQVPTPDYDDYFKTLTQSQLKTTIVPGLLAETSRGCWWGQKNHCTFCGLNGDGINYRTKSTDKVLTEFAELSQRYKIRKFEVVDNILSQQHLQTLIPQFSEKQPPYTLFYETKANLSHHDVEKLAKAGVNWIQPGIENLHDQVLKLMNKGTSTAINIQLLKWGREFGIRLAWNILVDFPGEQDDWYAEMAQWLPLIVHLEPPNQVRRIRYDRFSPYHNDPAKYGISIAPFASYSYIYPLESQAIADLAYFFEKTGDNGENLHLHPIKFDTPGLQATQRCVNEWRKLFWGSKQAPLFCYDDHGHRILLFDTRPCATERVSYLYGLERLVFLACDQALTFRELLKKLQQMEADSASPEEVQQTLMLLKERHILLEASKRFLSLAVRGDVPSLPREKDFAGGYLKG